MAKLLTIKSDEVLNQVLNKLVPSWKDCFNQTTIEKAQTPKSQSRNYMFGTIMNAKFIKLNKACAGFKAGDLVAICDIYEKDSANNLVSLMIYRLGHSGLAKQPTIVEA